MAEVIRENNDVSSSDVHLSDKQFQNSAKYNDEKETFHQQNTIEVVPFIMVDKSTNTDLLRSRSVQTPSVTAFMDERISYLDEYIDMYLKPKLGDVYLGRNIAQKSDIASGSMSTSSSVSSMFDPYTEFSVFEYLRHGREDVNTMRHDEDIEDLEFMDDFNFLIDGEVPDEPSFPTGRQEINIECCICLQPETLRLRLCCSAPICNNCMQQYCNTQIKNGIVKIGCPSSECDKFVCRDEILARLETDHKLKFYQFLVNANAEPHIKTCPRCSNVVELSKEKLRSATTEKEGLKVCCPECNLLWCFPCQAPWHEGLKCSDFNKGDKLLKYWAKEFIGGQQNAQKCPKCNIFIQRVSGCDHMTCCKCNTHFCYRCGGKFYKLKFLGDHYSSLSVFGCKYKYYPDKPVRRRTVRGLILGGKLAVAPAVAGFAVCALSVLVGLGTVALPFYCGYRLHKKLKRNKHIKRQLNRRAMHMLEAGLSASEATRGAPDMILSDDTILALNAFYARNRPEGVRHDMVPREAIVISERRNINMSADLDVIELKAGQDVKATQTPFSWRYRTHSNVGHSIAVQTETEETDTLSCCSVSDDEDCLVTYL